MDEAVRMFLAFCAAIVSIGGATLVIKRWIYPALKLSSRVKDVEDKTAEQDVAIKDLVDSNNLMLECMVYLIRNALTKNSHEDLEKMEKKVIKYITNRGGSG